MQERAIAAMACATIGFIAYFFIMESGWLRRKVFSNYSERGALTWHIVWQRLTGFLFLGIMPVLAFLLVFGEPPSAYGFRFMNMGESLLWILGFAVIIVPINYVNARKPASLEQYPQIRLKNWGRQIYWTNSWSWSLYLLAYEMIFRGYLLFATAAAFGKWPAIALNVCFYALVHIPKGLKETLSSIPFGFVICLLTLRTETIWIAVLVHVMVALTNDLFAVKAYSKSHL